MDQVRKESRAGYAVMVVLGVVGCASLVGLLERSPIHSTFAAQAQQTPMQLQSDGPVYGTAKFGPAAGVLPIYDFSGNIITGAKCAQGSVMSDATGAWSVDYSALGFSTAVTRMDVSTSSPGTTITALTGMYTASYTTPTLTGVSGRVAVPATIVIGGLPIAFSTTPVRVYVAVCGS